MCVAYSCEFANFFLLLLLFTTITLDIFDQPPAEISIESAVWGAELDIFDAGLDIFIIATALDTIDIE